MDGSIRHSWVLLGGAIDFTNSLENFFGSKICIAFEQSRIIQIRKNILRNLSIVLDIIQRHGSESVLTSHMLSLFSIKQSIASTARKLLSNSGALLLEYSILGAMTVARL